MTVPLRPCQDLNDRDRSDHTSDSPDHSPSVPRDLLLFRRPEQPPTPHTPGPICTPLLPVGEVPQTPSVTSGLTDAPVLSHPHVEPYLYPWGSSPRTPQVPLGSRSPGSVRGRPSPSSPFRVENALVLFMSPLPPKFLLERPTDPCPPLGPRSLPSLPGPLLGSSPLSVVDSPGTFDRLSDPRRSGVPTRSITSVPLKYLTFHDNRAPVPRET